MAIKIIMPHMGESVVEGTIIKWLKRPGDRVRENDPIVEIETDKINVEVPSPASGVLLTILAEEGATVSVEQTIAMIGEAGEEVAAKAARAAPVAPSAPAAPPRAEPARPPIPPQPPPPPPPPAVRHEEPRPDGRPAEVSALNVYASPAVRRFAREQRVDLRDVAGSGRLGRITKGDVEAYLERKAAAPKEAAPPAASAPPAAARRPPRPDVDEELLPLSPMRRAIAEHMVRSKQQAPHVTTVAEVDMTDAAALRQQWSDDFAAKGTKLTYMAFIVAAVARALREHPEINATWTDKGILIKYRINIGMAVAVEEGLVVPVIRDADRLSILELARRVQDLADKTRQGKISPNDVQGGTFTITNPGIFGAVISTPIIHQPQAAILATGRIADTPAVVDGAIQIRKRMFLSLSYDHRIVDGAAAVGFLQRVREILERAEFSPE
jgi:2-oxoglutarate dehydrogenase complex dihydrolipoamide succinyltransferase (E2) component